MLYLSLSGMRNNNVSFLNVEIAKAGTSGYTAANFDHVTFASEAWSAAIASITSSEVKVFAVRIGQVYACLYGPLPWLSAGCLSRSQHIFILKIQSHLQISLHLQATPSPSTASTYSSFHSNGSTPVPAWRTFHSVTDAK